MQQQQSEGHWRSRVECLTAMNQAMLAKLMNEFYAEKFVVGTHVFREDQLWTAFIYYKVKE